MFFFLSGTSAWQPFTPPTTLPRSRPCFHRGLITAVAFLNTTSELIVFIREATHQIMYIGRPFHPFSYVPSSFLSFQNSSSLCLLLFFYGHRTSPPSLQPCTCCQPVTPLDTILIHLLLSFWTPNIFLHHCMSFLLARPTSHPFTSLSPSLCSIHVLNPSRLALAKQSIIDYSFSFLLACCRHLKPLVYPQLRFSLHILGLSRCAFAFPQDCEPMSGLTPQHGLIACNTVLIKIWPVIVKLSTR